MATPRWPDEIWSQAVAMAKDGHHPKVIGKAIGKSPSAVHGKLWRELPDYRSPTTAPAPDLPQVTYAPSPPRKFSWEA